MKRKPKKAAPAVHADSMPVPSNPAQRFAVPGKTGSRLVHSGLALVALLGMAAVLWATGPYGIGATSDSVQYVSCARSLVNGEGFRNFEGAFVASWPPLFSAMLAVPALLGFEMLSAARYLQAFFLALAIYGTGLLSWEIRKTIWAALVGALLVLVSDVMVRPCLLVWSEAFFNVLVTLFLLFLARYLKRGRPADGILLSVLAALACLQRYVGVMLVMALLCSVIVLKRDYSLKKRFAAAGAMCAAAVLPLALWLLRNYRLTGTLSGPRGKSGVALGRNIDRMLSTLTGWFFPVDTPLGTRLFVLLAVGILLFSMYLLLSPAPQTERPEIKNTRGLGGIVCFVVLYLAGMLLLATIVSFDPINDRILAPVFVPIIVLILFAIDKVIRSCGRFYAPACCGIVVALIVWIAIVPAGNCWKVLSVKHRKGSSYTSRAWNTSPLVAWLKANPLEGVVYCNMPDAVYLQTGIVTRLSPRRRSDLRAFDKRISTFPDVYFVWCRNTYRTYLYNPRDMHKAGIKMRMIAKFKDGFVVRFMVPPRKPG